jgi:acyl carrier protein
LVAISGFSMKRVGEDAAEQIRALSGTGGGRRDEGGDSRFAALLAGRYGAQAGGISPGEGAEVLLRVLAGRLSQVVVSTVDLPTAMAETAAFTSAKIAEELANLAAPRAVSARPEVKSLFIAPGNDLEQRIAAVWQRVLGIGQIGIHDNFFELGGTSLSGVQLIAELKKALSMEIPSVSIFEAPTVAALARHLAPKGSGPVFEHTQERARKKQEMLERQREQLSNRRRGARGSL